MLKNLKDDRILAEYRIKRLPTTIFINTDGSVHDRWTGALAEEVLVEKVGGMLPGGTEPRFPRPRGFGPTGETLTSRARAAARTKLPGTALS